MPTQRSEISDPTFSGVDKHHDLMASFQGVKNLFIADVVQLLFLRIAVPCFGHNPNELLLERNWPMFRTKEEQASFRHLQEFRHIRIVGQGCGKGHNANLPLSTFNKSVESRDDGLDHCSTLVCEQMHFVNNEETAFVSEGVFISPRLAGDD
jgi:hypothetical protein